MIKPKIYYVNIKLIMIKKLMMHTCKIYSQNLIYQRKGKLAFGFIF